jgi:hypothetical protein
MLGTNVDGIPSFPPTFADPLIVARVNPQGSWHDK